MRYFIDIACFENTFFPDLLYILCGEVSQEMSQIPRTTADDKSPEQNVISPHVKARPATHR